MSSMTPVELVMIGLWSSDNRTDTIQRLCGASVFALEFGYMEETIILSDCALMAVLMMRAEFMAEAES